MAKREMAWCHRTQTYRGTTQDSMVVDVAGDTYAQALENGVKAEAEARGWNWHLLTDRQRVVCQQATYREIDDPDTWGDLVGEDPTVTFV